MSKHDELLDEIAEQARAASLKIYHFARDYARQRGIIIADTKNAVRPGQRQIDFD